MSYTKTTWVNDSSPDINADNLNHIEQGIYDAHQGLMPEAPTDNKTYGRKNGAWSEVVTDVEWGDIGGDITEQTDLQTALGGKVDTSSMSAYRTATAEDVINATKADKTALDKTDRSLDMLWKLNKGQTWDFDVDTDTLYTKTVPSGAKYDSVDMVGGKSVVVNQLVQNGNFESTSGWFVAGTGSATLSISNNTAHIDVTTSANLILQKSTEVNFIASHKYFVGFEVKPSANTIVKFLYTPVTTISVMQSVTANTWNDFGQIFTVNQDYNYLLIYYDINKALVGGSIDFKNIQLFDLTQMFGAGNEPSTVADFKAMFPNDYYPYNTGEIKSASVDSIIVKDDDEVTTSTFNVPSAIQSLTGYGWSAGSVYNEVNYASKKYIQRVGSYTFTGNETWAKGANSGHYLFYTLDSNIINTFKGALTISHLFNGICAKVPFNNRYTLYLGAECLALEHNALYVLVKSLDNETSTANDLVAYLQGVTFYGELATPIETDISSLLTEGFMENFDVESGGTLSLKNSNGDGYRIPAVVTNEFIVKIDEVS